MKTKFWITAGLLALSGCTTTLEGNKVDYKSQGKVAPSLEIPPDLTQITKNAQALVPAGGAANASAYLINPSTSLSRGANSASVVVPVGSAVRVQREGTQYWLVVDDRSPEKLWEEVKAFWVANGFTLVIDQVNLGIMETDWNENRAKLPQDGFRRLLGQALDALFSTNERDKYRTRLERTASGGTEVFISHRGLAEDFTDNTKTRLEWKPRPRQPDLEIEFLKRLMVRLGAPPEAAKTAIDQQIAVGAASSAPARAKLMTDDSQSSLLVNDAFDQAWRRVGLSLDRTNFTVEDRDRSKGIYFVRYVESQEAKEEPGFFARMFGAKASDPLQKYQIMVTAQTNQTKVVVASSSGEVLNTTQAKNILKTLADDLQ
jgi:outer membrane protein assembly factor BamC